MPKLRFIEQDVEVEVPIGTSILEAARKIGAPEGDACGGVCACSTCPGYVEEGDELLSEAEADEENDAQTDPDTRASPGNGAPEGAPARAGL